MQHEQGRKADDAHNIEGALNTAIAVGALAAVLRVAVAVRKVLEHPDENYRAYRLVTGISMLVYLAGCVAVLIVLGEEWFLGVMAVGQGLSYLAIRLYEHYAEDETVPSKRLTEGLGYMAAVAAVVAIAIGVLAQ